jgi:hypoxanthine phosphoribosyltransferase
MLPPVPSMVDIRDSRVLIVDDVADTGHTLKLVNEFCLGQVRESRIAVLYEKPRSIVKVDYCWRRTDKWVNFPWSDTDPVVQRAGLVADA